MPPLSVNQFFDALSHVDDHHSLYVTKAGEVKCQGRIGTFFTYKSTFQRSTQAFLDAYQQEYDDSMGKLTQYILKKAIKGKPLKTTDVKMIKDFTKQVPMNGTSPTIQTPSQLEEQVDNYLSELATHHSLKYQRGNHSLVRKLLIDAIKYSNQIDQLKIEAAQLKATTAQLKLKALQKKYNVSSPEVEIAQLKATTAQLKVRTLQEQKDALDIKTWTSPKENYETIALRYLKFGKSSSFQKDLSTMNFYQREAYIQLLSYFGFYNDLLLKEKLQTTIQTILNHKEHSHIHLPTQEAIWKMVFGSSHDLKAIDTKDLSTLYTITNDKLLTEMEKELQPIIDKKKNLSPDEKELLMYELFAHLQGLKTLGFRTKDAITIIDSCKLPNEETILKTINSTSLLYIENTLAEQKIQLNQDIKRANGFYPDTTQKTNIPIPLKTKIDLTLPIINGLNKDAFKCEHHTIENVFEATTQEIKAWRITNGTTTKEVKPLINNDNDITEHQTTQTILGDTIYTIICDACTQEDKFDEYQATKLLSFLSQQGELPLKFLSPFFNIYASEHSAVNIKVSMDKNRNVFVDYTNPENCPLTFNYCYQIPPEDGVATLIKFSMCRTDEKQAKMNI